MASFDNLMNCRQWTSIRSMLKSLLNCGQMYYRWRNQDYCTLRNTHWYIKSFKKWYLPCWCFTLFSSSLWCSLRPALNSLKLADAVIDYPGSWMGEDEHDEINEQVCVWSVWNLIRIKRWGQWSTVSDASQCSLTVDNFDLGTDPEIYLPLWALEYLI